MSDLKLDSNVFSAGADAAAPWGSVSAAMNIGMQADVSLNRGINFDLGLSALANIDASIGRYLAADLSGSATAQASIQGQVQLPMNLFTEIGLAVRLQAIAELAAGLRVGLGLRLGDFLNLAGQDPKMAGLPMGLLRVFLEETEFEAGFYVKAALSAQAYANFVITGSAIGNPQKQTKPGFTISAGAGAGLKAGAGYQVFVDLGVKNFGKLVARMADIVVDETLRGMVAGIPPEQHAARDALLASRIPLKLAIRLTYELGEQLTQRNGQNTRDGQSQSALRVVQVCLEELQRGILEAFLTASLRGLTAVLQQLAQAAENLWVGSRPQRYALADLLESPPSELFSADTIPYWLNVIDKSVALAAQLGSSRRQDVAPLCAMLWCAVKLVQALTARIVRADAHVSLIGSSATQVSAAFSGAMDQPDAPIIDTEIRGRLARNGATVSGPLTYEHVVVYLVDKTAVDLLQQHNGPLADFLNGLLGEIASDTPGLVSVILKNGGAFGLRQSGAVNSTSCLVALGGGMSAFVKAKLSSDLRAQLSDVLAAQPDAQTAFDEILLPSVGFALDVVFVEIQQWATSGLTSTRLTEALSAILLRILGRSLVVTGDILLAASQAQIANLLQAAARDAGRPRGLVSVLSSLPGIGIAAGEVGELVEDALEIGAATFGPIPDDRRRTIRQLLYRAIDPLSDSPPGALLRDLANPSLVPNVDTLNSLARELGGYAIDRLVFFVERLFERLVQRSLDSWRQALDEIENAVTAWIDTIAQAIVAIEARLQELAHDIAAAVADAERQLEAALGSLDQALTTLAHPRARARYLDALAGDASGAALGILEGNWVYTHVVPSNIRAGIRATVRDTMRAALDNNVVDAVLGLIGGAVEEADGLFDDIRAVNPNRPLGPQIREILLTRLVSIVGSNIRDQRIRVKFSVSWVALGVTIHQEIDLGYVTVPVELITRSVREMCADLDLFENAIDELKQHLGAMFRAEDHAAHARLEHDGVSAERTRLSKHVESTRPAARSIRIEQPVPERALAASAPIVVRFDGFDAAILDHDPDTPTRVYFILNGEPIDVGTLRVQPLNAANARPGITSRGAAVVATAATGAQAVGPVARKLGATRQFGAKVGSASAPRVRDQDTPARSFAVVGELPPEILREGINTILVEAFAAKGQRVSASVGFLYSPSADVTVALPRHPPVRAGTGLPKALLPRAGKSLAMSRAERDTAAAILKRTLAAPRPQPLARLPAISPVLATRLQIAQRAAAGPRVLPAVAIKR